MKHSNCVIISQPEWLNWIARGYLRLANERIRFFNDTQNSFNALINSCSDSVMFDDSLIFVTLTEDHSRSFYTIKRTALSNYLSFKAIDRFYALNERGYNRLEDIIEKKGVNLFLSDNLSIFWKTWQQTQLDIQNHDKGNKLLNIFNYKPFIDVQKDSLLEEKIGYYNCKYGSIKEVPTDNSKKRAYAWLHGTFILQSIVKKEVLVALRALVAEYQPLKQSYTELTTEFLSNDKHPLLNSRYMLAERLMYENIASEFGSEEKSLIIALTFRSHYQRLIDNDIEIDLINLRKDLLFLDKYYDNDLFSRTIVYFLAQNLDENYITPLYIASNLDKIKDSYIFDYSFYHSLSSQKLNFDFKEDEKQIDELFEFVKLEASLMFDKFKKFMSTQSESENSDSKDSVTKSDPDDATLNETQSTTNNDTVCEPTEESSTTVATDETKSNIQSGCENQSSLQPQSLNEDASFANPDLATADKPTTGTIITDKDNREFASECSTEDKFKDEVKQNGKTLPTSEEETSPKAEPTPDSKLNLEHDLTSNTLTAIDSSQTKNNPSVNELNQEDTSKTDMNIRQKQLLNIAKDILDEDPKLNDRKVFRERLDEAIKKWFDDPVFDFSTTTKLTDFYSELLNSTGLPLPSKEINRLSQLRRHIESQATVNHPLLQQ